jgi:hypothetical protein
LLAFWTQEIECGVAGGQLVRLGRLVTLHSPTVVDNTDTPGGAQETIAARTELARKRVAETPGVSVAVLAQRCGVSRRTIYRALHSRS